MRKENHLAEDLSPKKEHMNVQSKTCSITRPMSCLASEESLHRNQTEIYFGS